MQEIILKESKEHGDISFPFAYYHVTSSHPRYVMETHWHEEYEICRVLEGELKVTIDGQTYMGKGSNGTGDIFIFNSGSVHSAEPINCVYECMVFDLHFLLRERSLSNSFIYSILYNQRQFKPHIPFVPQDLEGPESLNRTLGQLFTVLQEQTIGYELKTFGLMYYLLGIFEHRDLFVLPNDTGQAVNRIMKMRMALSYIHRNYKNTICLNELSELLELRPQSVVKLFKDIINKKPMEYINSYRVQCAMEMLKDQTQTVTNVAYECGFTDVSYFTKVFKKFTNKTPREYLKNAHDGGDILHMVNVPNSVDTSLEDEGDDTMMNAKAIDKKVYFA